MELPDDVKQMVIDAGEEWVLDLWGGLKEFLEQSIEGQ